MKKLNIYNILLLFLVLAGCQVEQEELLKPQEDNNLLISKAKSYLDELPEVLYVESTNAKLYQFTPLWYKAKTVHLNNGNTLLITGVQRDIYVKTYYTGFVRRMLFEFDSQDNIVQHKIVEIVSQDRDYLKANESDLYAQFWTTGTVNFTGSVIEYDSNYSYIQGKYYDNGTVLGSVSTVYEAPLQVEGEFNPSVGGGGYSSFSFNLNFDFDDYFNSDGDNERIAEYLSDPWGDIYDQLDDGESIDIIQLPEETYDDSLLDEDYRPEHIEDPDGAYQKYKERINEEFNQVTNMVNNPPFKLKDYEVQNLQRKRIELRKMKKELRHIEKKGNFTYKVYNNPDGTNTGGVGYDASQDKVLVILPNAPVNQKLGGNAHEFKHVYQLEKGKVSLSKTPGQQGVLNDLQDEVEAYKRQYIIQTSISKYGKVDFKGKPSTDYSITEAEVLQIGEEAFGLPNPYASLPTEQITIFSNPQGTTLQAQGTDAPDIFVIP